MIPLASLCSPSRRPASGGRLSKGRPPRARLCAPNPLRACPSGHLAPIASYTRPSAPYVQEPVADSEHLGSAALILDASPLACSPEGGQKCQTHCRPRLMRTAWSWKTTECECLNIEVRLVPKPR